MNYNYDFWYQPRHNVMVSSEWAAPKTYAAGFKLEDVEGGQVRPAACTSGTGRSARSCRASTWAKRGMIPLEVRFHHNPDSTHGFVGAALSQHDVALAQGDGDEWQVEKVIEVEPVEVKGWPFPVPGLITDLVLSMDDRWLYFSNWLHGDIRQYDISDPAKPKLTGQVWLGGVLGKAHAKCSGRKLAGGPQMLQLSLDGKRLYVTNSLFSSLGQPVLSRHGQARLATCCRSTATRDKGGLKLNDSSRRLRQGAGRPARAHEMRFPGGDCTSDIWI